MKMRIYICLEGHMAIKKSKLAVKSKGKSYPNMTYLFEIEK